MSENQLSSNSNRSFALGIDLGTSSIKISVVDCKSGDQVYDASKLHNATTISFSCSNQSILKQLRPETVAEFSEQCPRTIWRTLLEMILDLPEHVAGLIQVIGVTGQQHGCVLWHSDSFRDQNFSTEIPESCLLSNLVTWQDQRCVPDFLRTLPEPEPKQVLATGYGVCTLFWYLKNDPEFLERFDMSGTIMDFVAWLLCGAQGQPAISDQNAEAWGYFNRHDSEWNRTILANAGFPVQLLPTLRPLNQPSGNLSVELLHIRRTIPVTVAMGDLQCSFRGTLREASDAVLNFSTSSQFSFIAPPDFSSIPSSCDMRSYFDKQSLIVAPSLNGGNVLDHLVQTVINWGRSFGVTLSSDDVWTILIARTNEKEWEKIEDPLVQPLLFGERYSPNAGMSITGIHAGNLNDIGALVRGIIRGIIANLHDMIGAELLRASKVKRILLTGSVFEKFPQAVEVVSRVFCMPVEMDASPKSAAWGAAVSASRLHTQV